MNKFIFKQYSFDPASLTASFNYAFENGLEFNEEVKFADYVDYDEELLDKALFLSFILTGLSYYKLFPKVEVEIATGTLDSWQVNFFNQVYQNGLSQFAYENNLARHDLAHFTVTAGSNMNALEYSGDGILALQSGGKDSLLTAALLYKNGHTFTPWFVSYSPDHPVLLDEFDEPLRIVERRLDRRQLAEGIATGGMNGHVPVTYIVYSFAIIDAILSGKNTILASIGHEGEEPHAWIDDLPVNHQWAKTWPAEQLMAEYVEKYISADLKIGSPLRQYTELKVAELFVENSWSKFGHSFSSCNLANYKQGSNNSVLTWCGACPKCANSFLLFAPFLLADELLSVFGGQDLFAKDSLQQLFKGLLGIDGVIKPFECVGEVDELRFAYQLAQKSGQYVSLPFAVPDSIFDYEKLYSAQDWASILI